MLACPRGTNGEYIARELAQEQTLENLEAFGQRLALYEKRLRPCTCGEINEGSAVL